MEFKNKYYKLVSNKTNFAYLMQYSETQCIWVCQNHSLNGGYIADTLLPNLSAYESCTKVEFGEAYAETIEKLTLFIFSKI